MPLASDWEQSPLLRNRGRLNDSITVWPSPKTTGIASMKACSLNAEALELTATWWVQFCTQPAAIPIDLLRAEVGRFREQKFGSGITHTC